MGTYSWDNAWHQARQRLAFLEDSHDAVTIRRLQAIGVDKGWHCLEVGAGGGSIAQWLCARVGSEGRVVATDIDTRFLDVLPEPNLQVLRHNIVTDELPISAYDLIHTRKMIMHLPARDNVLARLVAALKPGGWLLLEEDDVYPIAAVASGPYAHVWDTFIKAVEANGTDPHWARYLPALVAAHNLNSVTADTFVPTFNGTSKMAEYWRLSFLQVLEDSIKMGEGEPAFSAIFNTTQDLMRDPTQWFIGPALIGVWGQRPA